MAVSGGYVHGDRWRERERRHDQAATLESPCAATLYLLHPRLCEAGVRHLRRTVEPAGVFRCTLFTAPAMRCEPS